VFGAEREVVGVRDPRGIYDGCHRGSAAINANWREAEGRTGFRDLSKQLVTLSATDEAKQWEGWNTTLKPSWEPIVLARKPLVGTVVENVLEYGTGGLNIDGCRLNPGDYISGGGNNFDAWRLGEDRMDRPKIHRKSMRLFRSFPSEVVQRVKEH
jgi:hypothetical protein